MKLLRKLFDCLARRHPSSFAIEFGFIGAAIFMAPILDAEMNRAYNAIMPWSPMLFLGFVISMITVLVGLACSSNISDEEVFASILRPVSGILAVMMAYMFILGIGETDGILVQKISPLIFCGLTSLMGAMLFAGLVKQGIEDLVRCAKCPAS